MSDRHTMAPQDVLKQFEIFPNVYLLGTFETGLTVYNQQMRALNLAWAMVGSLSKDRPRLRRVAVVGGGFAGLTAAAGLLKKGVEHVSIFEKRAALCPLQEGSDARWVHPRIYDWPRDDSILPTAALPLLNWNAGRASDVVVEVLRAWREIEDSVAVGQQCDVYLNVKHLRLDEQLGIEWVGAKSGTDHGSTSSGKKETFGSVVLAIGFGVEKRTPFPYWRNETLGQPELHPGLKTYLVSGQGDGALVDLFRIRISRFRQDRILVDLVDGKTELRKALQKLKEECDAKNLKPEELFARFEELAADPKLRFEDLRKSLRERLRADTSVVLQMSKNVDSFHRVFTTPQSFQNRFLLFALFSVGGVIPTTERHIQRICDGYGIKESNIIRRHGPERMEAVTDVLDKELLGKCRPRLRELKAHSAQTTDICWTGGYWDLREPNLRAQEARKDRWRKEYLPPATEVLVTGFLSAVAWYLETTGKAGPDFRVTLHRTLYVGGEVTLQQAAQYCGNTERSGKAGRTFRFDHGAIGYAAGKMKIVRSRDMTPVDTDETYSQMLQEDTAVLEVSTDSQPMASSVRSILAIPILTPNRERTFSVLFADSTTPNIFTDQLITVLRDMCQAFATKIESVRPNRVANFPIAEVRVIPEIAPESISKLKIIQTIDTPSTPYATTATYLNVEFTDFIVGGES